MKKILFFYFIGLLIFSCGNNVSTDPPQEITLDDLFFGSDSTFEVVTWNIEHFPKAGVTTKNYVVQIILAIDADVFALQEIESSTSFNYIITQLNEQDSVYSWDGYRATGASYDVNLAYIYKNCIIQINDIYEIYQDDWYAFPRSPLVFEITYENEELKVINNHLKAGGYTEDEARRQEASQKLQVFIDSTFSDTNVIVVGDLNDDITEPQGDNVFWNFIEDTENYLFADLPIAEGSYTKWSYPSWPSHLDHILITNELFDEYENSTVQTILIDNYLDDGWHEYNENISDHRPVGMKFIFE